MIKITITSMKVDASFVKEHTSFVEGERAYYIIRSSGERQSGYFHTERYALEVAWSRVVRFGYVLVKPW